MQKAKSFRKITLSGTLKSCSVPSKAMNNYQLSRTNFKPLVNFAYSSLFPIHFSLETKILLLPFSIPATIVSNFDLVGLTHTDAECMFEWDSVSNVSNPKSLKIWHWIFFSSSLTGDYYCTFLFFHVLQSLPSLPLYGSHILVNIYIFIGPNLFILSLKRVRFQKIIKQQ